jgi:uncharacterized membrane protein YbaN (DUF454 family)
VLLLAVGWGLVLLGLAGLVLPGLQGFLTLLAAAACLSAGSATVHGFLRERFRRWPKGWRRMEKGRKRLHGWLRPKRATNSAPGETAETSAPPDLP